MIYCGGRILHRNPIERERDCLSVMRIIQVELVLTKLIPGSLNEELRSGASEERVGGGEVIGTLSVEGV